MDFKQDKPHLIGPLVVHETKAGSYLGLAQSKLYFSYLIKSSVLPYVIAE